MQLSKINQIDIASNFNKRVCSRRGVMYFYIIIIYISVIPMEPIISGVELGSNL